MLLKSRYVVYNGPESWVRRYKIYFVPIVQSDRQDKIRTDGPDQDDLRYTSRSVGHPDFD